jgi:hypothetical protein
MRCNWNFAAATHRYFGIPAAVYVLIGIRREINSTRGR